MIGLVYRDTIYNKYNGMSLKGFLVSVKPGQPGPPLDLPKSNLPLREALMYLLLAALQVDWFQTVPDWSQTQKRWWFQRLKGCFFILFLYLENTGGEEWFQKFDLHVYCIYIYIYNIYIYIYFFCFKCDAGGLQKFLEAGYGVK